MLLGERNLGPKLIGVFPGGRMEEFIDVRNSFENLNFDIFPVLQVNNNE